MEQSEASKRRQRVYTPAGVPAPKQKEISRRTAQLEAEKLKEKETVNHRRASAQWEGIAARLGKSIVEGKRAASSPLSNIGVPGSDLLEGGKRAASSPFYDVGASGSRVESREMIREVTRSGEKYEKRKEFVGNREDGEAKVQEDERVTGASTTSKKSSGPTHKPLRKPSSYLKETTHTSALSDELDINETVIGIGKFQNFFFVASPDILTRNATNWKSPECLYFSPGHHPDHTYCRTSSYGYMPACEPMSSMLRPKLGCSGKNWKLPFSKTK